MSHHIATSCAAVLFGAGGVAYATAGSLKSLAASCTLGTVFAASSYVIQYTDYTPMGYALGATGGYFTLIAGLSRLRGAKSPVVPLLLVGLGLASSPYYSYKVFVFKDQLLG
ncbi:unnamed protein product [Vitrella brassicaformis CCMP3155]|uniref:Transmembrane protein 14C n=2 Tax=Vitrella brassicaformis TaxID=1169539 RepID=A0A0G4GBW7_VITBC|nr:unnamed protein product [Vitrella brassicaformis CCMP3155]|eukprot:CEM26603.1 unnamed protein product [Vitrella brassicaformis CCMP3155]